MRRSAFGFWRIARQSEMDDWRTQENSPFVFPILTNRDWLSFGNARPLRVALLI